MKLSNDSSRTSIECRQKYFLYSTPTCNGASASAEFCARFLSTRIVLAPCYAWLSVHSPNDRAGQGVGTSAYWSLSHLFPRANGLLIVNAGIPEGGLGPFYGICIHPPLGRARGRATARSPFRAFQLPSLLVTLLFTITRERSYPMGAELGTGGAMLRSRRIGLAIRLRRLSIRKAYDGILSTRRLLPDLGDQRPRFGLRTSTLAEYASRFGGAGTVRGSNSILPRSQPRSVSGQYASVSAPTEQDRRSRDHLFGRDGSRIGTIRAETERRSTTSHVILVVEDWKAGL